MITMGSKLIETLYPYIIGAIVAVIQSVCMPAPERVAEFMAVAVAATGGMLGLVIYSSRSIRGHKDSDLVADLKAAGQFRRVKSFSWQAMFLGFVSLVLGLALVYFGAYSPFFTAALVSSVAATWRICRIEMRMLESV